MKIVKLLPIVLMVIGLSGCSNMTRTEQHVVTGAAIGTVAGALIGGNVGSAAIGAGVGAAGGYVYDRASD